MKKTKKIILRVIPIIMVLMVVLAAGVFAVKPELPTGGNEIQGVTNLAKDIWTTVAIVVQILAIAAIVIAGVRYMFASSDQKADIKKQTMILVVGAILVFAAVPIAQFITNIVEGTLGAQ